MPLLTDVQLLAPGNFVSLYTLDATAQGGGIFQWHNMTANQAVVYHCPDVTGTGTYSPFPIQINGLEVSTSDVSPRPKMVCGNMSGVISSLLRATGDIVGAKVSRVRTFSQYLASGTTPADTTQYMRDVWYVYRKTLENNQSVQFDLCTAVDVQSKLLPGRQVYFNACPWSYRGADGCGYSGPVVHDSSGSNFVGTIDAGAWSSSGSYAANRSVYEVVAGVRVYFVSKSIVTPGTPLTNTNFWSQDVCFMKSLRSCKAHFNAPLPFGGFPGAARVPATT